jgi:hypothetical protein
MTMRDADRTKPRRNRSRSSKWNFLFIEQGNSLPLSGKMLKILLLTALSINMSVRAGGQITSTSNSSPEIKHQELPDAPSTIIQPLPPQSNQVNSSSFSSRFGQPLQPMNAEDKMKYFLERPFGPRAFFTAAVSSGIRMANPPRHYPPEWHSGAEAYGRFYGDSFARSGAESTGRFSASVFFHEDPRYRRSKSTSATGRLAHALAFTFVDRTDGGRPTIALSNFTGGVASGFIGNAYLPSGFDNLTHAGQRSTIAFAGLAGQNIGEEFAPNLAKILRKIHVPHVPMPPVWWTKDN